MGHNSYIMYWKNILLFIRERAHERMDRNLGRMRTENIMSVKVKRLELADYGRFLTAMAIATAMLMWAATATRAQGPVSVADLAERLSPAVVNISTSQKVSQTVPVPQLPDGSPLQDFFEEFFKQQQDRNRNQQRKRNSLGSGFVIDPSGIIVTNQHVIADADEIEVTFNDQTKLIAKVLGQDSKTDLAVLKVEPEAPLPALEFGSSEEIRVGDWVLAIGNPFGLGGTVTLGIVSARNRNIDAGPYDAFLQTDAAINRGNSGGPLFNMEGKVIGINTAIISPTGGSIGLGFAIPASVAKSVIEQLVKFGETRRGWLGVRIQTITDEIAETLELSSTEGALVAEVTEGGPAEAAGLMSGDVITRFDGKPVPQMRDLPRIVAETSVGKEVEVVVVRKGEEMNFKVTLGRLEEAENAQLKTSDDDRGQTEEKPTELTSSLGLTLSPLTDDLRQKYSITDSVQGVVITEVDSSSVASEMRIQPGDVIVEVAQEKVASPKDVQKRIEDIRSKGRKAVLLTLASKNGDVRFSALRFERSADDTSSEGEKSKQEEKSE